MIKKENNLTNIESNFIEKIYKIGVQRSYIQGITYRMYKLSLYILLILIITITFGYENNFLGNLPGWLTIAFMILLATLISKFKHDLVHPDNSNYHLINVMQKKIHTSTWWSHRSTKAKEKWQKQLNDIYDKQKKVTPELDIAILKRKLRAFSNIESIDNYKFLWYFINFLAICLFILATQIHLKYSIYFMNSTLLILFIIFFIFILAAIWSFFTPNLAFGISKEEIFKQVNVEINLIA